jgi:hypothetical protein
MNFTDLAIISYIISWNNTISEHWDVGTIGCWTNIRNIRVSEQRGVGIAEFTMYQYS